MELQFRVKSTPGAAGPEHNRSSRGRFGSMGYKVRQAFEWFLSPETASVGVDVSLGRLLSWLLQLELIQPVFLVRSKKTSTSTSAAAAKNNHTTKIHAPMTRQTDTSQDMVVFRDINPSHVVFSLNVWQGLCKGYL